MTYHVWQAHQMDLFVHGRHARNQVLLPLDLVEDML